MGRNRLTRVALALVQLAVQGNGCHPRPDLFHGMRCLSRSIGARLGGQLARTKRQLLKLFSLVPP